MAQNNQLSLETISHLDQLDSNLRSDADKFLEDSGLGQILKSAGFTPVGSYNMHTMVWRDLDFERIIDVPDWNDHWCIGQELAKTGWVWRFSCIDAYRDQCNLGDFGYYWGIRASHPDGGPMWKLDIWTARSEEFAPSHKRRAIWNSLMTEQSRLQILAVKEAVCMHPEYRKNLLSIHIYEAVLERQITSIDAFWQWWLDTYA